jgi:hypothetical protein
LIAADLLWASRKRRLTGLRTWNPDVAMDRASNFLKYDTPAMESEIRMIDVTKIEEHMEVVGSDGQHVGTVDNLGIKLTKNDPAAHGQHHYIKLEIVASVTDRKVVLSMPAAEALDIEKAVEN